MIRSLLQIDVVSTPDINITVPTGPLYAGTLSVNLICTISLNSATDREVNVEDMNITWLRGTDVLPTGARETISSVNCSRRTFASRLTLSVLSIEDTSFTCQAQARPPPGSSFITMSEAGEQTVGVPVES